jgi:hypothetical protein
MSRVLIHHTLLQDVLDSWLRELPRSPAEPRVIQLATAPDVQVGVLHAAECVDVDALSVAKRPMRLRPGATAMIDLQSPPHLSLNPLTLESAKRYILEHLHVTAAESPPEHSPFSYTVIAKEGLASSLVYRVRIDVPPSAVIGTVAHLRMTLAGATVPGFPLEIPISTGGMNPPIEFGDNIVAEGRAKRPVHLLSPPVSTHTCSPLLTHQRQETGIRPALQTTACSTCRSRAARLCTCVDQTAKHSRVWPWAAWGLTPTFAQLRGWKKRGSCCLGTLVGLLRRLQLLTLTRAL